jgi:hypothetical protein
VSNASDHALQSWLNRRVAVWQRLAALAERLMGHRASAVA